MVLHYNMVFAITFELGEVEVKKKMFIFPKKKLVNWNDFA